MTSTVQTCPNCGSTEVHFRKKRGDWVCDDCEHRWGAESAEDIAGDTGTGPQPIHRRIFLSYGHDEHTALALRLKADLEERGHQVWFDLDRLKPGGDWEHYIEEGLHWAGQDAQGCALLLMTPHSVRRPDGYCLNEIAWAVEKGLFTVPVMAVQVEPPLSIARLQWLDMTSCVPLDAAGPMYEDRRAVLFNAIGTGKVDFEGAQARLLHLLQPIKFSTDIMHHLQRFSGREWVLKEIECWLSRPPSATNSRVFWITGAPGVGKTALSVWLASKVLPAIKAWHLCQHNHDINKDPKRCVASIAYYLSQLLPDCFEKLKAVDIEGSADMTAATLFRHIIVEPLESIPAPAEPVVILIDALDEAMQRSGRNELAEFIGLEFDKTPEWLRLIVTSRPVPEVEAPLSRFSPWRLDTADPRNFKDIADFTLIQLRPYAPMTAQLEAAVQAVVDRSEGVFLYAWYVCEEVAAKRLDIAQPDTFPQGLNAVYLSFFRRQFPDVQEYDALFAPVFEMMAAAREPLTVADLAGHFGWTGRQQRRFQEGVGALFRIQGEDGARREGPIEPFHKSVMDWLTTDAPKDYYVDPQDGAKALTDWGWQDYEAKGPDHLPAYFFRHLPAHLAATGRKEDLEAILTDFPFLQAKLDALGPQPVIDDYDLTGCQRNDPLGLIQGAIRLSAHVIAEDTTQFAGQLIGRMLSIDEPRIRALLQDAHPPTLPWLCPMTAGLTPPGGSLLRTFPGHSESVQAVAIAPDGKRAISGSWDHTLKLWDLEQGKLIKTLEGHSNWVSAVAIARDEKLAISGSHDETVRLWELESGKCIKTLKGHQAEVTAVAIAQGEERAISGSWDKTVRLWDLNSGKCTRTLKGHEGWVQAVAIAHDGKRAISGSRDKTVKLWDLNSGKCTRTLKGHEGWVQAVAIAPDGKRAISAASDHSLKIWDLDSGNCIRTLKGHEDTVTAVAVAHDGKHAVSGSRDKTVKLWDLNSGRCIQTLKGHEYGVNAVAIAYSGKCAISGSYDTTLKLWELESGKYTDTLKGYEDAVNAVAITPDGKRAISAASDHTLKLWGLESEKCANTLRGHEGGVRAVAIAPDGKHAVSGSRDKTVKLWDFNSGRCIRTLEGHEGGVRAVAIAPDGKRAISAASDHSLKIWDLDSGDCIRTLRGHEDPVNAVAIAPGGKRAISASSDRTLKLWDLNSGRCVATLKGHKDPVPAIAIGHDGKRVISGSYDRTIKLWDLKSGKCIATLQGHERQVLSVAITPDGKRAISASGDQTLKLWDLESRDCVATFAGEGAMLTCAFTPDGKSVVAGDRLGRVHFLRVED